MKIQIGKTYELNPKYKKSVVDTQTYTDGEKEIDITTVWRWGTWFVTPQNVDEVEWLENALTDESTNLCMNDFEDYEMRETWDGCSEEIEFVGDWTDEQKEQFEEDYYETGSDALDNRDFEPTDCYTYIQCEIDLKEIEK